MKKILLVLILVLTLALSGCGSKEVENQVKEELNQIIIIVEFRNDYYTFERGYYYAYSFTVEDTNVQFKNDGAWWFYSNEKWEIDDVVIVTEDNDELYFLRIGNLNYE